jgi:hypothetical protein
VKKLSTFITEEKNLHMEHLDALMVMVDIAEVVEALEYKVAWIIKQASPGMVACFLQKHFV